MTEPLYMWTVYDHPRDYPDQFVARKFEVLASGARPTDDVVVTDSLNAIRDWLMERGLTRIVRSPGDEPQIVETWL